MPDWSGPVRKQLASLKLAPAREAEIVEELTQHAEDSYRELRAGGTSEAEARRLALDQLTGLVQELRPVERTDVSDPIVFGEKSPAHLFSGIAQDIRYGFRTLRKNPRFTAVAMLALALGIGANTAIFSVVNGVLLQPLAYPEPDRLLRIFETTPEFSHSSIAYPNYLDWRRESHSFTDMGTYRTDDFILTGAGQPERLPGVYVSASLFPVLGVTPILGRNFLPDEDRQGAACSVMLSYGFWQDRFAGDRNILARTLTLKGVSCSVTGVLPQNFQLGDDDKVYVPLEQWNSVEMRTRESHPGLRRHRAAEAGRSDGGGASGNVRARQWPGA